jgi:hypothetical protein
MKKVLFSDARHNSRKFGVKTMSDSVKNIDVLIVENSLAGLAAAVRL